MKKTFDYQKITPYQLKNTKEYNPKKCFKYYMSRTKKDMNASIQSTYRYIKNYYNSKSFCENMQLEEQYKTTNELLHRYEEANKAYKYSYSNLSSIIVSFIISLCFIFLQIPSNDGQTYFEKAYYLLEHTYDIICEYSIVVGIILMPLFFMAIALVSLAPLTILLIVQGPVDLLYYSKYRNFIIPFERATIIETLKTYNDNYSALE